MGGTNVQSTAGIKDTAHVQYQTNSNFCTRTLLKWPFTGDAKGSNARVILKALHMDGTSLYSRAVAHRRIRIQDR